MDLYAVIMAGGKGTRFWPLSRQKKPKQFLPIISEKTMLEETILRLHPLIPRNNIFTIADKAQSETIKTLTSLVSPSNILTEPMGKNTAPSLLLATAHIFAKNPKAVAAALPADHLIRMPELFRKKLKAGAAAALKEDALVTFGIPPSFPATGYGYIQFKRSNPGQYLGENFYQVQMFKEKPDASTAKKFIKAGNYYWNSGMFIWRAETFAGKIKKYAPELFPSWEKFLKGIKEKDSLIIEEAFKSLPATSIDYALMEKAEGVLMAEGDFGWSDVGSWSALADIWDKDSQGNTFHGKALALEAKNCILHSPSKLTALVGVENLIVIDTDDALLICRQDLDQKVREIVEELKKKGEEHLT